MNNRQVVPRTQLLSADPVSAFRAASIHPLNWVTLVMVVLTLSFASLASAQSITGNAALDATLYNANCDPCQGATVGSIKSAIKNAANAMEYLIVNRRGESSDD